jgi:hypothetical protein
MQFSGTSQLTGRSLPPSTGPTSAYFCAASLQPRSFFKESILSTPSITPKLHIEFTAPQIHYTAGGPYGDEFSSD